MEALRLIETEIDSYLNGTVDLSGQPYSQNKLVRRIMLFANQIFPTGKLDTQDNYKYYFDIITPRKMGEVKNVDFDTKDITLYSDQPEDYLPVFLSNAALKEWLRDNGQADELNDAIEEAAGWGNVVWKKVRGGYERCDLKNLYVINQTAKSLDESPVIERHEMTQSQLRAKKGTWSNVDEVIKECGDKTFNATAQSAGTQQEIKTYEIFERNGEISEKALFELQKKEGGSEDRYVLAKIVVAGLTQNAAAGAGGKYILYADTITKMPYKEHHRGSYNGRWWRLGLYEALFDVQVRANEIGNQIARGLEWASKTFFRSKDDLIAQNALTDLMNGDILKSEDLQQVTVRMEGLDQLIADWNRIMEVADRISNSFEVVTGEVNSGDMPFRLGALMNQNANKLFDFLREKLALSIQSVFEDWILPDLLRDLRGRDVLRLTGNSDYLKRFYQLAVDAWYVRNLPSLPPHGSDVTEAIKAEKLQEIMRNPEMLVTYERELFQSVRPRVQVRITGEQTRMQADMETRATFIQLETDPVRRSAMIEEAMALSGLDVGKLPKSDPQAMQPQQQKPAMAGAVDKQAA